MPSPLENLLDFIGTAGEKVDDAIEAKEYAEGILGQAIINGEMIRDGNDLRKRLAEKAKAGEPPSTLRFLFEVGSFVAKNRR